MKTLKASATDRLVADLTAFRTWADMRAAMDSGYIPTLNGGRAYAKLADICNRNGYRVFRLARVR